MNQPTERPYRRGHAPLALAALAGIVILAAFGVAPILLLGRACDGGAVPDPAALTRTRRFR